MIAFKNAQQVGTDIVIPIRMEYEMKYKKDDIHCSL